MPASRLLSHLAALAARLSGPTLLVAVALTPMVAAPALAQVQKGAATGQPLPRFANLKSDKVYLRQGPGENYDVTWVYQKAGLPVEVMQEYENWRKIRDSEGTEGWVFQSLLTNKKRTALIAPWSKGEALPLFATPDPKAAITAYLSPGVLANVASCTVGWCRLKDQRFDGWIKQTNLWGVYPDEKVE